MNIINNWLTKKIRKILNKELQTREKIQLVISDKDTFKKLIDKKFLSDIPIVPSPFKTYILEKDMNYWIEKNKNGYTQQSKDYFDFCIEALLNFPIPKYKGLFFIKTSPSSTSPSPFYPDWLKEKN